MMTREDINNKAYDDEINKASDEIGGAHSVEPMEEAFVGHIVPEVGKIIEAVSTSGRTVRTYVISDISSSTIEARAEDDDRDSVYFRKEILEGGRLIAVHGDYLIDMIVNYYLKEEERDYGRG